MIYNTFLSSTQYHPSWRALIETALRQMDQNYLQSLSAKSDWLPGMANILNAFTLPLNQVNYVLLGESPYPRAASANGFAFWDQAIGPLWSETGLSKPVNRATSFRNILKMLFVAGGYLSADDTSQASIARIDKHGLVQTNADFFNQLLNKGFLLLNASLVLRPHEKSKVKQEAAQWAPFIKSIIQQILETNPNTTLILLGKIAEQASDWELSSTTPIVRAEHPYNISFINNPAVIAFFAPLRLLLTLTPSQ